MEARFGLLHALEAYVVESLAEPVALETTGVPKVLTQAVRDLDARGVVVQDVGLRRPTLDDVFLTLTGREQADDESEQSA